MSTLGSINVKIGADAAGLTKGLGAARDAMGRFVSSGNRAATEVAAQQKAMGNGAQATAFRVGQAFGSMGKDAVAMAGSIGRGVMAAGAAVEKFGGQVRSAGQGISSMGQSLSIGLTAPLGVASAMALKASGDMEQAQISFTTLLGSAKAAGSYIEDLKKFSAETPFEFAGVRQGAQQLMAFGFEAEEVIPMLTSIGDGLSAMGNVSAEGVQRAVIALGQMKASGTVLKEDLNQLIALNIPVFDILSKKLGLTAKEVARIGESGIESGRAITAILEGMNEKFGGSMAKQSQTLMGLWSTMKDNASFIFADIGDAMVEALDLRERVKVIIADLAGFLTWFKALDNEAKQTAIGIGIFLAALGPALIVVGQLVTALGSFVMVLGFIATPMGLVVAGAVAFTAAMADALVSSQALRDNLMAQWPQLKSGMGQAWEGMQSAVKAAQLAMKGDWTGFSTEMEAAMSALGSGIGRIWDAAIAALEPVMVAALDKLIGKVWEKVKSLPGMVLSGWAMILDPTVAAALSGVVPGNPIPGAAGGGLMSGPGNGTSDSILARLSTGEFVMPAAATARNLPLLEAMRAKRFAAGGMVGSGSLADYAPSTGVISAEVSDEFLQWLKEMTTGAEDAAYALKAAAVEEKMATARTVAMAEVSAQALEDFANGAGEAEKGFEWLEKPDAADAWAYATEKVKDAGKGVQEFAASANQASTSVAQASQVVASVTPEMQRYNERAADALQNTEFSIEAAGETLAQKIKGVAGSFVANIEGMFPSLKNAQKMFDAMNKGAWTAQNGNAFFDFGALKSMQEGNLRLLAVMEKGGEALNREWLDSLMGTSAAWSDQLLQQTSTIGQATEAQGMATEATRTMSDSLIQATDSVSGSFVAAGEGVLASASATAGAGEWIANTFLASGQVVNRAAASMSAGLASASSGVLAAASAAVSAIGSQLAQIGASSGLSELARQMQNAGLTGAVEATLPGGSPSGLESSGGSMGSSRGNSRNGGGWVNGGYGQLPPIVLVLDGKEVHTSVQGYGNYYGAGNVSGGFS